LLIDAIARDGGRRAFLVETHSEHLILRLLRRIREATDKELPEGVSAITADQLSVLYVESHPDGVHVRRLQVDERGEFRDTWPKGFFDERFAEIYGA
jgi:predicted ATPase